MTATIRQQLVTSTAKTSPGVNPVTYITIHETANLNNGANAAAHANLQSKGNDRTASWHYTVDSDEIVQSFRDDQRCWHAGDGSGSGNLASIGIEICVNLDGDFNAAVTNAAALVQTLMARHGVPLGRVVQHNKWSGKNCPTFLRSGSRGITWAAFIAMVSEGDLAATQPAPPAPPTAQEGYKMDTIDLRNAATTQVRSEDVGKLQALLMAHGYGPAGLVGKNGLPDKAAGPQTRALLGHFQAARPSTGTNGKPDYVCGPRCWHELIEN